MSSEPRDPEIVCIQLQNLENAYKHTQKGVLAYTLRNFLRMAIECGKPQLVLDDPVFQTLFWDAQLATDCGWRPVQTKLTCFSDNCPGSRGGASTVAEPAP